MTTLLTPSSSDAPPERPTATSLPSSPPAAASAGYGRRPRRRERRGRRHSAYEVIVVGLVAYALAALLNARGLDRRAEEGELGPRRDVLSALTGVLADVAHGTGLDRPGTAIDALRWRSQVSAEPAVAAAASPTMAAPAPTPMATATTATSAALSPSVPVTGTAGAAPAAPADEFAALATSGPAAAATTTGAPPTTILPTTTTAPPYLTVRTPTPEDPLRVWVGGDSLAQGLGWSFSRLGAATGLVATTEAGRISSSLARPDYFDWPDELARVVAEEAPEVIVVMFGANDPQAMADDNGRLAFGTPEWQDEYRARVRAVMALGSEGRRLIWVGEPVVRDGTLDARMQVIDAIQREEAAQVPNVSFVDGRTLFGGPDGGYTNRLPTADGGEVAVRGGDGVHPNAAGYDRLAAAAAWEILRLTDPAQAALPAPPAAPGAPPPPLV